ncbi:hypothetical protein GUJ93_ZPchr0001g31592 [Zizania palustris]|uniref:Protein decapping 5 n=1 Tax=Zizania palustris TaxID=103762 RepID=A0A8J5V184_ZIZPA|nr:hypothetical protein GUJ93_ZPchr0001g31592 [Zizania palustris]KAG8053658.1 hypothetical protein GUJ93_ZPchr0001g31592 [Zizania palustris]
MAAEAPPSSSSAASRPAVAAGSSGGAASPDSYIGSLISLTSKSDIRYEGILYNISTEESSIGLRNVRSFGTEGRKKDGMQIPPSDKVYEYILFRGSDIKDLQVKSSPPPPPPQPTPLHNDPAIIQSHYSQPASTLSSLPSAGSVALPDLSSQASQYGLQRPIFQSNIPLYQPGNAPWGSSAPPSAASAPALSVPPMYWQGYYAPSGGLPPHLQQPPLLQPTPGLSVPQSLQYSGLNPPLSFGPQKLSELQPPLLQPPGTSQGPSSGIFPTTAAPATANLLAPETSKPMLPNMGPLFTPVPSVGTTLPLASLPTSIAETSATASHNFSSLVSNKIAGIPGSTLAYQTVSQAISSTVASSSSAQMDMPMSSTDFKSVEPKTRVVEPLLPDPPSHALPENKEPILPLTKQTSQKYNGAGSHINHNFRGRGRGRGSAFSHSVTKFTEEFDFMAMNEKFNKDEVWGHLGKKSQSRDNDGEEDLEDEETENPELAAKPVYVKDDFFDSLTGGTFGHGGQNGRPRFSEQRKTDTETFGDFPRLRQPYRGGGRGYRGGGGRTRGSYYGGRSYGNMGRGGQGNSYPHRGFY